MKCITCGFDRVPEGARFCPQCRSLIPLAPLIDFSQHITKHTRDFTGRHWVFRAIDRWLRDPKGPRVFLLTGEPGCGKTTIAARVVQFSQGTATPPEGLARLTPGFLSAHHFCSGDHRWISPHRFAEAVSQQLCRYPAFASAVIRSAEPRAGQGKPTAQVVHQEVQQVSDQGMVVGIINIVESISVGDDILPEDAFVRLVLEPLQALGRSSPGSELDHRPVILVDGLDEALAYSGKVNIVSLLAGAKDMPAGVRFLLTCRNDDSLISRFPARNRLRINLSGKEYVKDGVSADIDAYVIRRWSEPKIQEQLAKVESVEGLRQQLIDRAAGNFLYIQFLLDEVANGKRALEDLAGLPQGLYGLYRIYLDRLMPEMREALSSDSWLNKFQPLLGCLSVAMEPVPADLVADWLHWPQSVVTARLGTELGQLVEVDDGAGYRLYHRSMADFLTASTYPENGSTVQNRYYTPPHEQHTRIASYYLSEFEDAWGECDPYGLQHLARHVLAGLSLAERRRVQRRLEEQLYSVVLNGEYRKAQREILGELGPALSDLQAALDLALKRDDLVKVLPCAGAYRDTIRSQSMADAIFAAVDASDLGLALKRADLYSKTPDWARVLFLYLAWESALLGDDANAHRAAVQAVEQPLVETAWLCDALVAHTARILSQRIQDERDAQAWFTHLHPEGDAQWALGQFGPAPPVTPERWEELRQQLTGRLRQLQRVAADEYGPEDATELVVLEDEERAYEAASLKDALVEAAADPGGRQQLAATLQAILPNPYPHYRDIALSALGIAVLAAAEPGFIRKWLRRILYAGLDQEGVTFTFNLPFVLRAEAERRGKVAPKLEEYLDTALSSHDRWGTSVRAHSARAAALFRQGHQDQAFAALRHAALLPTGFAGFATMTLLSLVNRWLEFGQPEEAVRDISDLLHRAAEQAEEVNDPDLQTRRRELVQAYHTWLVGETPDFETAAAKLRGTPDRGTRRTYKDHISARWCWPPTQPNWEALKALVPLTLVDGTRLDSVLARLVGLRVRQLSDEDLDEAIRICTESLATGRPWEAGQPR